MPGLISKFQSATRSRFKKGIASKIYALHDRMEAERQASDAGSFNSSFASGSPGRIWAGGGGSARHSQVENGFGIDGRRQSALAGVARVNRSTIEAEQTEKEETRSRGKRRLSIAAGLSLAGGSKDSMSVPSAAKSLTKSVGVNASKIASSVRRKSVSPMGNPVTSPSSGGGGGGGRRGDGSGGEGSHSGRSSPSPSRSFSITGAEHAGRSSPSPSPSFSITGAESDVVQKKHIPSVLTTALGGLTETIQLFGADMRRATEGSNAAAEVASGKSDASATVQEWLRQQMVRAELHHAHATSHTHTPHAHATGACHMPLAHAHTQVIAEMLQQLTLQQQELMVQQRAHRESLDALSQQMLTLVQYQTASMEALVKVSGPSVCPELANAHTASSRWRPRVYLFLALTPPPSFIITGAVNGKLSRLAFQQAKR